MRCLVMFSVHDSYFVLYNWCVLLTYIDISWYVYMLSVPNDSYFGGWLIFFIGELSIMLASSYGNNHGISKIKFMMFLWRSFQMIPIYYICIPIVLGQYHGTIIVQWEYKRNIQQTRGWLVENILAYQLYNIWQHHVYICIYNCFFLFMVCICYNVGNYRNIEIREMMIISMHGSTRGQIIGIWIINNR